MLVVEVTTEVGITLKSQLQLARHAYDIGGTVISMELEAIRPGMLDILEKVLEVLDVAGTRVITVP
jgi:hypothetical protein